MDTSYFWDIQAWLPAQLQPPLGLGSKVLGPGLSPVLALDILRILWYHRAFPPSNVYIPPLLGLFFFPAFCFWLTVSLGCSVWLGPSVCLPVLDNIAVSEVVRISKAPRTVALRIRSMCVLFSITYNRRLVWPPHKVDLQIPEVFHIFPSKEGASVYRDTSFHPLGPLLMPF